MNDANGMQMKVIDWLIEVYSLGSFKKGKLRLEIKILVQISVIEFGLSILNKLKL